jgi:hypothetical protein
MFKKMVISTIFFFVMFQAHAVVQGLLVGPKDTDECKISFKTELEGKAQDLGFAYKIISYKDVTFNFASGPVRTQEAIVETAIPGATLWIPRIGIINESIALNTNTTETSPATIAYNNFITARRKVFDNRMTCVVVKGIANIFDFYMNPPSPMLDTNHKHTLFQTLYPPLPEIAPSTIAIIENQLSKPNIYSGHINRILEGHSFNPNTPVFSTNKTLTHGSAVAYVGAQTGDSNIFPIIGNLGSFGISKSIMFAVDNDAANNINTINLSGGFFNGNSELVNTAIDYAVSKGITVVQATGNINHFNPTIITRNPSLITVGASKLGVLRGTYSKSGTDLVVETNGTTTMVTATGDFININGGSLGSSGPSIIVAQSVSKMKSLYPWMTPEQIRNSFCESADKLPKPADAKSITKNSFIKCGKVNFINAFEFAKNYYPKLGWTPSWISAVPIAPANYPNSWNILEGSPKLLQALELSCIRMGGIIKDQPAPEYFNMKLVFCQSPLAVTLVPDVLKDEQSPIERYSIYPFGLPSIEGSETKVCNNGYMTPFRAGKMDSADITEASGLAFSRVNRNIIYTHNDSPDKIRFYALDKNGKLRARINLTGGAIQYDWEDIAVGPCPSGSCVYVGDIGDNNALRKNTVLYRVVEPIIPNDSTTPVDITATYEKFPFSYPDGPRDAETLMVHPKTGDIYIITKKSWGSPASAAVYKFPKLTPGVPMTLIKIPTTFVSGEYTGGDIHPRGDRFIVRNYSRMYEYTVPSGGTFDQAFSQIPKPISLPAPFTELHESQGEAATYTLSGDGILTTSEGTFQVLRKTSCAP